MIKARYTGWVLLMTAGAVAGPSDEDMARCAAIAARDTRLACYDVLAHRPADKVPTAAVTPAPTAAQTPAQPQAPTSAQAPLIPQTAASPAAIAADPKNFGLTAAQQHTLDLGPKSIAAHISVVSSNPSGSTFIVLDNDQTWIVLDNDGRLSKGDAVTIKRAALASFLMMTPSNHSYRVRRTK